MCFRCAKPPQQGGATDQAGPEHDGAIRTLRARAGAGRNAITTWRRGAARFFHDGGCLPTVGIHHVDLLRHLGGETRASAPACGRSAPTRGHRRRDSNTPPARSARSRSRPPPGPTISKPRCSSSAPRGYPDRRHRRQRIAGHPDPSACATNSEDFVGVKGHGAVYGYGHAQMYKDIVAFFRDGAPIPSAATMRWARRC